MVYFLLVVITTLSSGSQTVSVERFHSSYECFKAMEVVNKYVKGNTQVICEEIQTDGE